MVHPMTRTSFFGHLDTTTKRHTRHYLKVGMNPFAALAVVLIDKATSAVYLPEAVLKHILERLTMYFPKYKQDMYSGTPEQQFNFLVTHWLHSSELIACLAYVLRQEAVDELYANPLVREYQSIFEFFNRDTPKDKLRQEDTLLPVAVFAALAKKLHITLTLSFREPGKELRKRQSYQSGTSFGDMVDIKVSHERYFPSVMHPEHFIHVGQSSVHVPPPVITGSTETLSTIIDAIIHDRKRVALQKEHYKTALRDIGILTKETLLCLYGDFLPAHCVRSFVFADESEKKHSVNELLIDAMAEWMSTGQVDADAFFLAVEHAVGEKVNSLGI